MIKYRYISRVYFNKILYQIKTELVDGPFENLNCSWDFQSNLSQTIINFNLEFKCKSKILENMINSMLNKASFKLAAAFEKRAIEAIF